MILLVLGPQTIFFSTSPASSGHGSHEGGFVIPKKHLRRITNSCSRVDLSTTADRSWYRSPTAQPIPSIVMNGSLKFFLIEQVGIYIFKSLAPVVAKSTAVNGYQYFCIAHPLLYLNLPLSCSDRPGCIMEPWQISISSLSGSALLSHKMPICMRAIIGLGTALRGLRVCMHPVPSGFWDILYMVWDCHVQSKQWQRHHVTG